MKQLTINRVLIIGQCTLHWGRMEFGNIGNYYVLEPLIRGVRASYPNADIVTTFQLSDEFCRRENISTLPMELYYGWTGSDLVVAEHELAIATEYNKSNLLHEKTPYIEEVLKSDLVIDFSGDIWGDNADFLGDDRFLVGLCKDRVAQLFGKSTAMIAGSPGPFTSEATLPFAKEVFAGFNLVTNREPVSRDILESAGFDISNTKSLACPSFLFEATDDMEKVNSKLALANKNEKPIVGFTVCGWNFLDGPFDKWPRDNNEFQVFVDSIEYIINKLDTTVVLMSHSNGFDVPPARFKLKHGRDYPIIKKIEKIITERNLVSKEKLVTLDDVYSPKDTKAVIGTFDMMVSGRVHAAIAALSQCVPTVIIDYGHEPRAHKVNGFAKLVCVDKFVADPVSTKDMLAKIEDCWENKAAISNNLKRTIPRVKELAEQNFKLLETIKSEDR